MDWVAWYMVIWMPSFIAWGAGLQLYGMCISKGKTEAEVNKRITILMFEHRYNRWLTLLIVLATLGMFLTCIYVGVTELYAWYKSGYAVVQ